MRNASATKKGPGRFHKQGLKSAKKPKFTGSKHSKTSLNTNKLMAKGMQQLLKYNKNPEKLLNQIINQA